MRRSLWLGLASVAMAILSGCEWISPPNWYHPGPAAYQQQRAIQFDPYPEDETGPPVVGGRPLAYQNPPAEPTRARPRSAWGTWWGQPSR